MIKNIALLAAMLLSPLVVGAARPIDRVADRAVILDGERDWGQAFVIGDLAVLDRLLADDFATEVILNGP